MGWFYGVRMGFIASGKLSRKHGKSPLLVVIYGNSFKIGLAIFNCNFWVISMVSMWYFGKLSHNNGKLWSTNETMR